MKKIASTFIFSASSFDRESGKAEFQYRVEFADKSSEEFTEVLTFPIQHTKIVVEDSALQPFLQSLHLLLGISYWKMYCPPKIQLAQFALTEAQAKFWNTLYTKGLGEFFYKNQINFHGLVKFPFDLAASVEPVRLQTDRAALLPFGGGKDSIVSAHILKEKKKPFTIFTVNSHPVQEESIKRLGVEHLIVERVMDPHMVELSSAKEVLTGHVPATAVYTFTALMSAALFGYSAVVLSNEKSSSYGNVQYLSEEINHQWSKSAEAETLIQQYVHNTMTPSIQVFSILRPFYEIEITRRFTEFPEYFQFFSSCNRNFSSTHPQERGLWCGECPKCAFMFAMLSAFLPREIVIGIFGKNMFADENLVELYRELLGLTEAKPFECVGTPDEMKVALHLIAERHEFENDSVMQMFTDEVLPKIGDISGAESNMFDTHPAPTIPQEFA